MKIYIAGKITGDNDYKKKFSDAERLLSAMGHSVMNPARQEAYPEFSWEDYMAVSGAMQERCTAVLFLPDWKDSRGARIEFKRALARGQDIFYSVSEVPSLMPCKKP